MTEWRLHTLDHHRSSCGRRSVGRRRWSTIFEGPRSFFVQTHHQTSTPTHPTDQLNLLFSFFNSCERTSHADCDAEHGHWWAQVPGRMRPERFEGPPGGSVSPPFPDCQGREGRWFILYNGLVRGRLGPGVGAVSSRLKCLVVRCRPFSVGAACSGRLAACADVEGTI